MIEIEGGRRAFRALAFGDQRTPATMAFLQGQAAMLPEMMSMAVSDTSRAFLQQAQTIYQESQSAEAMRLARLALEKAHGIRQLDVVRPIWELGQLQNAPQVMQRWIMAEPFVRQMYIEQRIDGYSGSYVDIRPGEVGADHYDYRRVMNGVMVVHDETAETDWTVTAYFDPVEPNDIELVPAQQHDIVSTWDVVRACIKHGVDDPTNQGGGKL